MIFFLDTQSISPRVLSQSQSDDVESGQPLMNALTQDDIKSTQIY